MNRIVYGSCIVNTVKHLFMIIKIIAKKTKINLYLFSLISRSYIETNSREISVVQLYCTTNSGILPSLL